MSKERKVYNVADEFLGLFEERAYYKIATFNEHYQSVILMSVEEENDDYQFLYANFFVIDERTNELCDLVSYENFNNLDDAVNYAKYIEELRDRRKKREEQ